MEFLMLLVKSAKEKKHGKVNVENMSPDRANASDGFPYRHDDSPASRSTPRICMMGSPMRNSAQEKEFEDKAAMIRSQCLAERLEENEAYATRAPEHLVYNKPINAMPNRPSPIYDEFNSWMAERDRQMKEAGWQLLSLAIDSGAAETVIPHLEVKDHEIRETHASRSGLNYSSATGGPIPNLGEQLLPLMTPEGTLRSMTFQAAPVDRALGSVKRMCASGHRVVFDDEGSYVWNKMTGEINWFREENGNYLLDCWVMPNAEYQNIIGNSSFTRPR